MQSKDSKLNNNNKNLIDPNAWIYEELRKSLNWNIQRFYQTLYRVDRKLATFRNSSTELNVALAVATMVNEVDSIGANVAQKNKS